MEIALLLGLTYSVAYAGYWLQQSDIDPRLSIQAAGWCLAGLLATGAIATWILINQFWQGTAVQNPAAFAIAMLAVGAAAGILVGIKEVRIRQQTAVVTAQRHDLVVLNELLRHHVLNSINVILGRAEQIRPCVDGPDRQHVAEIEVYSKRTVNLVENLKSLTTSLSGNSEFKAIDVVSVLHQEANNAQNLYPDLTIEGTIPEAAPVIADDALGAVFEHLIRNAVQQSGQESPHVTVDVSRSAETVRIEFADKRLHLETPPGTNPFSPEDHADAHLGLYLVQSLVNRYDGDVIYEAREGPGAVLVITLPSAA